MTASANVAENLGSIAKANRQIAAQTGVKISDVFQVNTLNTGRARQFFIVYPGTSINTAEHVMIGINNGGKTLLYDPQTGAKIFDIAGFGNFVAFPVAF